MASARIFPLLAFALIANGSIASDAPDYASAWQGTWRYDTSYEMPDREMTESGTLEITKCNDNHCDLFLDNGNAFATCSFEAPVILISATKAQSTAPKTSYNNDFKGEPCRLSLTIDKRDKIDLDDDGECSYFCGAQSHGFGSDYRRAKRSVKKR